MYFDMFYCRPPSGVEGEARQGDCPPVGHQAPDTQATNPLTDTGRTLASDSLSAVPEVTTWPAQVAYDAYHDVDFTRGALQPGSRGLHEGLVIGKGQRGSQGLIKGPTTTTSGARGGVLARPGGLDYQDFSPDISGFDGTGGMKCTETFADLVARANDWLRQNPQLIVRSCETITWSTSRAVKVGDTESMVRESVMTQNGGYSSSYCFSCLRLWVIPKDDSSNNPSSFFSSASSTPSASSSSSLSSASSSSASSASCGQRLSYRDYKPPPHRSSLSRLVDDVNQDLKERPLPGRIATCETVLMPDYLSLDTGCLLWTESHRHQQQHQNQHQQHPHPRRKCIVFLRLFYIIGSITQLHMIGVKNIVPELVNGRYEPFSALLQRATLWVKKEKLPLRITNYKSCTTPCNACSLEEQADRCSIVWPEQTTSASHSASSAVPLRRTQQHYFQVLRLFYVRPHHPITQDCTDDDAAKHVRPYIVLNTGSCRSSDAVRTDAERVGISCAVFSPSQTNATNKLQEASFERMRQTMMRMRSWMQTAGIIIHSVESYSSPLLFCAPNHTLPELTYWTHSGVNSFQRSDRKFIMNIRVYYEQSSSEPPRVPKLIAPNAIYPIPVDLSSVQNEEERKRRLKEGRWRKRKLHLVLSCIMTFAICIPAGGLFYLNALQTEWGK